MKPYNTMKMSCIKLLIAIPLFGLTAWSADGNTGTSAITRHMTPLQAALKVGGSAGAEVDVWFAENTYWAKNRSGRKVRVKLGSWSALINPGQTFKFTGFGSGIQSFEGSPEANYED